MILNVKEKITKNISLAYQEFGTLMILKSIKCRLYNIPISESFFICIELSINTHWYTRTTISVSNKEN